MDQNVRSRTLGKAGWANSQAECQQKLQLTIARPGRETLTPYVALRKAVCFGLSRKGRGGFNLNYIYILCYFFDGILQTDALCAKLISLYSMAVTWSNILDAYHSSMREDSSRWRRRRRRHAGLRRRRRCADLVSSSARSTHRRRRTALVVSHCSRRWCAVTRITASSGSGAQDSQQRRSLALSHLCRRHLATDQKIVGWVGSACPSIC